MAEVLVPKKSSYFIGVEYFGYKWTDTEQTTITCKERKKSVI